MLTEIKGIKQDQREPDKRWFTSHELDLFVWTDDAGIAAFQLCFDKTDQEKAFCWKLETGISSSLVDPGEEPPGSYSKTPVLVPGRISVPDDEIQQVIEQFREQAADVDENIRELVVDKLLILKCPQCF